MFACACMSAHSYTHKHIMLKWFHFLVASLHHCCVASYMTSQNTLIWQVLEVDLGFVKRGTCIDFWHRGTYWTDTLWQCRNVYTRVQELIVCIIYISACHNGVMSLMTQHQLVWYALVVTYEWSANVVIYVVVGKIHRIYPTGTNSCYIQACYCASTCNER